MSARRHLGSYDVAVVGSGLAGSILARALARQGKRVLLVERRRHPRFALGESSTPLAALTLERLAARWEMPDLHHLAAYGRWRRHLGHLRRGLKRGFTFYQHRPGTSFGNDRDNSHRLLVAASPDDAIADAHWLRSDVDAHLLERAAAAGVETREGVSLDGVDLGSSRVRLAGAEEGGGRLTATAGFLVDASGPRGFLATHLPLPERSLSAGSATGLLYAHLEGHASFPEVAAGAGASMDPGPYPDERAAVHHLLEEGWLYLLPFDHGVASCGFLLRGEAAEPEDPPETAWRRLLARYPTLGAQLGGARFLVGPARVRQVRHRLACPPAGERYALLPHAYAFIDPMFSTGMAWSLLAVERLAGWLGEEEGSLEEYGELLAREADQIERLVETAYRARADFGSFAAASFLYFAVVSFEEARQRLVPARGRPWCWQGFLGAGDPEVEALYREAPARLASGAEPFRSWVEAGIRPRNVAGLADPKRRNLYPADLDVLVARAALLGLSQQEVRLALPRLRGQTGPAGPQAFR